MDINSTTSTSASTLGAPTQATTDSSLGPDAFLRLLVTQIRNQDPMQPMDTEGMMQQLTQLTSVERLVAIDDRLASLSVATAGMANSQAADLVGRTVEADSSRLVIGDGESVTGAFHLNAPAADAEVEIRDAEGRVVRTLHTGPRAVGNATFTWDGKLEDGTPAPAGQYQISVSATNAEGGPVSSELRVRGTVDAIHYDGGYPVLEIDGAEVMMGDVRTIERGF